MTRYEVTPITPVHIGNGQKLSPFVDYIVYRDPKGNESIRYVDSVKLSDVLHTMDLLDLFEEEMVAEKKTLTEFASEHRINLDAISGSEYIFIATDELKQKQFLQFVHTQHKVYLPGSTIKGAVHNALYYHWLKNSSLGQQRTGEIKAKINGGQSKALEWLNDESKGFVQDALSSCMKLISISDSNSLKKDKALVIDCMNRFNYSKNENKRIPICAEFLDPQLKPVFNITIDLKDKGMRQVDIPYGFPRTADDLISQLQGFYRDGIDLMLSKMKKSDSCYSDQLVEIRSEMDAGKNFLRVGAYKTFFFNTVAGILGKEFGKGSKSSIFPTTISAIEVEEGVEYDHIGWCEIKKAES